MAKDYIDDDSDVPCAAAITICLCSDPKCNPHVVLLDDRDKPFAQFIVADVPAFIRHLQAVAYEIAAMKKG
jgi:hypothetical protein